MKPIKEPYHLFADPIRYYNAMLDDIEAAKDYIYLETYRIGNDTIGIRFKEALMRKAREGLEIKVLVDFWGGSAINNHFADDLRAAGIELRFFEKIKFNTDLFTRSHRRNHRKLLLIDDEISYLGSSNLTAYNLNWRESVMRITGSIALAFKKVFKQDFKIFNTYVFSNKNHYLRLIHHQGFEIVRDMPSITKQRIMRKYSYLIKKAERSIVIVTPYFLPGYMLRKLLMTASEKGLDVKIIIPKRSDVGLVDILRNKYMGQMHQSGIQLMLYRSHNLHAKLLLIDDKIFSIGSSNFDYRSFRYMYEIVMLGEDKNIITQIRKFIADTIENTDLFDYEQWKRRPKISRFFEWMLIPFRHLL
ncbi:MAG: phosphatidylserine/phosphatidylglycerophosphate/cardiolipin synthase family protein [Bacteroidales bacterium]|jgi:cardiolipin synthase|nr:phosphatidylserine/phosphatidylglycerophosphate/cardiolipin synthase family protein [Bacteroidales bacterium]